MKQTIWKRTVLALSCIVVFITTYMMILPAITLEKSVSEETAGLELSEKTMGKELPEETAGLKLPEETAGLKLPKKTTGPELPKETAELKLSAETAGSELPKETGNPEPSSARDDMGSSSEEDSGLLLGIQTVEGPDYTVTADVPESALIPDGAVLTVDEITEQDDLYDIYYAQAVEALGADGIPLARFFDIRFETDTYGSRRELQPADSVRITVDRGSADHSPRHAKAEV